MYACQGTCGRLMALPIHTCRLCGRLHSAPLCELCPACSELWALQRLWVVSSHSPQLWAELQVRLLELCWAVAVIFENSTQVQCHGRHTVWEPTGPPRPRVPEDVPEQGTVENQDPDPDTRTEVESTDSEAWAAEDPRA